MIDVYDEFQKEGTVIIRNALQPDHFYQIDAILKNHYKKFAINDPYSEKCAEFAVNQPKKITEIYQKVADLDECVKLGRSQNIKATIRKILGENVKIYNKIPLRIDAPLVTKEIAIWHQDDFYVQGAPNEITAWIPLQDTPIQLGPISVMKKSHLKGKINHELEFGKKCIPFGVFDSPINIIEMKRGDVLFFNSFLLHSSNINFSKFIRYSIQIRFTSKKLGEPSKIMGELHDL
tara:strand:- start:1195 stop:1896 length:702 start_codon:yes stop_codon:yes gene_type:complete